MLAFLLFTCSCNCTGGNARAHVTGEFFFFLAEAESKLTVFNTLTLLTQVTPVYVLFNLQICLSAPDALRDSNSTFEV